MALMQKGWQATEGQGMGEKFWQGFAPHMGGALVDAAGGFAAGAMATPANPIVGGVTAAAAAGLARLSRGAVAGLSGALQAGNTPGGPASLHEAYDSMLGGGAAGVSHALKSGIFGGDMGMKAGRRYGQFMTGLSGGKGMMAAAHEAGLSPYHDMASRAGLQSVENKMHGAYGISPRQGTMFGNPFARSMSMYSRASIGREMGDASILGHSGSAGLYMARGGDRGEDPVRDLSTPGPDEESLMQSQVRRGGGGGERCPRREQQYRPRMPHPVRRTHVPYWHRG